MGDSTWVEGEKGDNNSNLPHAQVHGGGRRGGLRLISRGSDDCQLRSSVYVDRLFFLGLSMLQGIEIHADNK